MKQCFWLFVMALFITPKLCLAQAYDGTFDSKIFVGYLSVNAYSGFELQQDEGLGDLISYGARLQVLLNVRGASPLFTDEFANTYPTVDLAIFLRAHFLYVANLPETIDPYLGFELGLKSLGPYIGFKYNFSEVVGIYAQYFHSLSGSLSQTLHSSGFGSSQNSYNPSPALSIGLTISY
jgi:hypothetical protein